jgi:tRNA-splicing ligase RtcB (3'-phosphate/5'-hydroxy nucleic acid ligase)
MHVEQIAPYLWRIPPDATPGMRVPGLVVADEPLMRQIRTDLALAQLANGATLPGIVRAALAMPDIHQGYGLPVGGVVATDVRSGVVSPGAIGFDINCGVRLVRTGLEAPAIAAQLPALVEALYAAVPTGVGGRGLVDLDARELGRVMTDGARWAVGRGHGTREDLQAIESSGAIPGADPDAVSRHATERGVRQLGSLGSGNHFVEIQTVDEVYDEPVAERLGLRAGGVTLMIHTGSRGIGHQVCTDFIKTAGAAMARYGITVPDRQLACAPLGSPEARAYLSAMRAAANFAFANRQVLAEAARRVFERVLGVAPSALDMRVVYDVAHNIAKEEEHQVDGAMRMVLVHRKGATRAFPGQPVIVPGDMGRYSFVLVGTSTAMKETFGSTCHGAGRVMSRTAAVKTARGRRLVEELRRRGVVARAAGHQSLAEEMPEAYKDVREVVDVVHGFGISTRVARLRPLGVIKG